VGLASTPDGPDTVAPRTPFLLASRYCCLWHSRMRSAPPSRCRGGRGGGGRRRRRHRRAGRWHLGAGLTTHGLQPAGSYPQRMRAHALHVQGLPPQGLKRQGRLAHGHQLQGMHPYGLHPKGTHPHGLEAKKRQPTSHTPKRCIATPSKTKV